MSGMPPPFVPTTIRPRANASSTTRPSPSGYEGSTSARAASRALDDLGRRQLPVMLDLPRQFGDETIDHLVARALADDHEHRVGPLRCNPPPGLCEAVDVLVRLERADEDDPLCLGHGNERWIAECAQIAVGGKAGGRGPPCHARDERRGETGQRARRIGVTDAETRDGIGGQGDQPPCGRAVRAREGARIAVHLHDELGLGSREGARGARRGTDVRIRGDDHVCRERAQRAGDLERKPRIERGGAVGEEPEARIAVAGSGVQDAEVEHLRERIPLALEPGGEWQRQAPAADEENARFHRAASTRIRSSRS